MVNDNLRNLAIRTFFSRHKAWIFTGIITVIVCTASLTFVWSTIPFTDHAVWTKRTQSLINDYANGIHHIAQVRYSGHPGMAGLQFAAAISTISGLSAETSLIIAVSLLVSLAAAGIGYITYRISPTTWWWLPAITTAAFHTLYLQASPTNAIFAPYLVLLFLVTYYVSHHKRASRHWAILLGIVLGIILATRFPTAVFFGVCTIGYAFFFLQVRQVVFISAVAIVSMIVFNPLLWFLPIEHISHILFRTTLHISEMDSVPPRLTDFLFYAPLSFISILLSIIAVTTRILPLPIKKSFIIFTLCVTTVFSVLLLTMNTYSLRYFFPLFFWWEIMLPLTILLAIQQIRWPFKNIRRSHLELFAAILLACLPLFLLIYSFHLPEPQVFIDWEHISPLIAPHTQQLNQ